MRERRGGRRKADIFMSTLAILALACLLAAFWSSAALAQPIPNPRSWTDDFSTSRRVASTSNTKISGNALKLAEGDPDDLGPAVPGEKAVYSLVAVGDDVYSGTGPVGHLVHYDADKVYQEGYQGPSHRGVSSSKGQVSANPVNVGALVTDGAKVFGGTSEGHVFTYDTNPALEGSRPDDKGPCPGVTGEVMCGAFYSSKAFFGTSEGYVFSYDDAGGTFASLGQVSGASSVNAMAVVGGSLFVGLGDGHVWEYAGVSFADLDAPGAAAVNALLGSGTVLYAGLNDGNVYSYDTSGPGPFVLRGGIAGGSPVSALAERSGVVFAGSADGRLFSGLGVWVDEGTASNVGGKPVNALAVSTGNVLYGGTGNLDEGSTGRLFRRGVDVYEDWDQPGGSGAISSVAFYGKTLYVARGDSLYRFTSPGVYELLGAPSPGQTINDIDARSAVEGTVFLGLEDGHLWTYNSPLHPGGFEDMGAPTSVSAVKSVVAWSFSSIFVGLEDGRLLSGNDMTGLPLAELPETDLNDMCYKETATGAPSGLYAAATNGKLYRYETGSFQDLGDGGDATTANAITSQSEKVYVGHDNGKVYSYDGSVFDGLGTASGAIRSMAPGSQGVMCGTLDGKLYAQNADGALFDEGAVPHGGAVLALCHTGTSVWIGTDAGYLSSHDDAHLGDLGAQVNRQIMIWCMTYDPVRHVFYAGTYTNAHFLVIDPETRKITDLGRPIPGERELEDIIVTSDGAVVGSTYGGTESAYNPDGGHVFTYEPSADPAVGDFTNRGRAPDNNWWISSLVEGPEPTDPGDPGLIYAATSNSAVDATHQQGTFFTIDESDWSIADIGVPVAGEGTRTLTRKDDVVYGATWIPTEDWASTVYKYTVGVGFETLGEAPIAGDHVTPKHVNRLLSLGNKIYAAQNNGNVFSFEATATSWEPTVLGKPVPQSASVYPLAAGEDETLLCGVTGQDPTEGCLVNWDDSLGSFRNIDVSAITSTYRQDRVASIALQSQADGGTMLCGTRGAFILPGAVERETARIFKVGAHVTDTEATALSTVVDPLLEELTAAFTDQVAIGAVCPAPGEAKQIYVGTADGSGADAKVYEYDSMSDTVLRSWTVNGQENIYSLCPGPDGKVYVGTGNSLAYSKFMVLDPAHPLDPIVDIPTTTLNGYKGIHALVTGPDSRIYIGAGDHDTDPSKLISYDPGAETFTERGPCSPSRGSINGLLGSGGKVIGVTGSPSGGTMSAESFSYTPGQTALVPEGVIGTEFQAAGLAAGPGGNLYCGTGPGGQLFWSPSADINFQPVAEGWPAALAGEAVSALAATPDAVYGCAGAEGTFFKYVPGTGFTVEGPMTVDNAGVTASTTDNLGKLYFGTTGSGTDTSVKLLRYNPTAAFTWLTAGADSTAPPGTTAAVNLRNTADDLDPIGSPIGTVSTPTVIEAVTERALRFKATLSSADDSVTPTVTGWEATWQINAAIDQFVYEHSEGVYPGDNLGVWGSGFGPTESPGTVNIGGQPAYVNTWQPNWISVIVPEGATDNTIVIVPADGGPASSTFNLLSPPQVTQVNPDHARLGDYVDIHGSGFLASRGAEESVSFNGVGATSFASWSDDLIRVRVPDGASSGTLAVSVNHHASNQVPFTVDGGGGPIVNITAPADGASLKGAVTITATVQRVGGTTPVELWLDGVKAAEDASAPYTFEWNADAVADGAHSLMVKAVDGYSRVGSDTITVYVDHTTPTANTDWYFAEGCTDYGFETWVLIGNPQDLSAIAHVTFLDEDGQTYRVVCDLPPNSRTTVNAADVAPQKSVSVQVSASRAVVCERAMYWAGRVEGHDTIGSTELSRTWYFAEGSTDWGFETYTLLCNPGDSKVRTTLNYLFSDGSTTTRAHELAPHSRLTVNAAEEVGARDFSIRVNADAPGIVAERSMYHGGRRCGTNTIGVKDPSLTWYLSEGSTDWGFETWLLIERPSAGDARVTATYRLDTGETIERIYDVKGNSRFTVDLFKEVGVADVSTQVTSDVPVVCERSMYWNGRAAGHCTVGSPGPGKTWFLAEGCTDYGFETWVLLDNPSDEPVGATVTFLKEDGTTVPLALTLQPRARFSLDASVYVGAESFSTRVAAASPVMVERAMYWNARGGGTGSIGAR